MADIQVVLVEDEEQTRVATRAALRAQPGIEVASEATNGETGIVLLESIDVDVAVVDGSLPDMSISKFAHKMRQVQADSYVIESKLLILVNPGQETDLSALFCADADAYCLKQVPIEQLAQAVRITHTGTLYLDPAIAQILLTQISQGTLQTTANEQVVATLKAIADGGTATFPAGANTDLRAWLQQIRQS
jgi:anaerobic magnesium-protoporphyrin IX monomethyl ester cyclase